MGIENLKKELYDTKLTTEFCRSLRDVLINAFEAYAEPDEGGEHLIKICSKCGSVTKKEQPLKFGEGDLVIGIAGSEKDRRAIFQRYTRHTKEWCWVLNVDSDGVLMASYWLVENIKLIQKGFSAIRLPSLKRALTGS